MTTTNKTHADFSRAPLTAKQAAWLRANRIEPKAASYGFYFSRGEMWVEPIAATDTEVAVSSHDPSEDGDGARVVATFPRLRDALRYLAARA